MDTIKLSTLQDTIARAIAKYPEQKARIERGAALVALGKVKRFGERCAWVTSQTDDRTTYLVTTGITSQPCNCQDAQNRPELTCKHCWALDILWVAEERQRRLDHGEAPAEAPILSDAEAELLFTVAFSGAL